jgi:hypothetical protein
LFPFTLERVTSGDMVAIWWLILASCAIFTLVVSVIFFIGWKLKCFSNKKIDKKVQVINVSGDKNKSDLYTDKSQGNYDKLDNSTTNMLPK